MNKEKWILREIEQWVSEGIIDSGTADRIRRLYEKKNNANTLLIIFSIIGSILVGAGIIMISAKNWYDIPVWGRVSIAFIPLIAAQALSVFVLLRRMNSLAWREGVGIFLTLTVFTTIALVGQIFHLPGDFGSYVLVCGLLSMPVIYILNSTSPAVIYIWTILNWTALQDGVDYSAGEYGKFWLILLATFIAPYICYRIKNDRFGARGQLLAWAAAIGGFFGVFFLHMCFDGFVLMMPLAAYFSVVYILDLFLYKDALSYAYRPFKIVGWTGNIILLIILSYLGVWGSVDLSDIIDVSIWPYAIIYAAFILAAIWMYHKSDKENVEIIMSMNFIITPLLLILSHFSDGIIYIIAAIAVNIYLLIVGMSIILKGVSEVSLGYTNVGMIEICFLIILRFFDWELDLLQRGIAFLLIGVGFLCVNWYIIKKRKAVAE